MASDEGLEEERLISPLRASSVGEWINRVKSAKPRSKDADFLQFENTPWYMVAVTISTAVVQGLVVLGAYFFTHSAGLSVLPKCKGDLHFKAETKSEWADNLCFVSSYCFWTFPILCPFGIVLIFWKNLLEKRLFYECLMNRIFLTYRNIAYLSSPTFWCVICYALFSFSCFFFVDRAQVFQAKTVREIVFSILTYLTPFAQFWMAVFTQWSPNTYIVSLAMFFNTDSESAMDLVKGSKFIPAHELHLAWEEVEDIFDHLRRKEHVTLELNTEELMGLLVSEHEELMKKKGDGYGLSDMLGDRKVWRRRCHFMFWRNYWITRLLWFDQLKDRFSGNFRLFARIYIIFMVLASILFVWAMVSSTQEWIIYQQQKPLPGELDPLQDGQVRLPGPHEVLPHVKPNL